MRQRLGLRSPRPSARSLPCWPFQPDCPLAHYRQHPPRVRFFLRVRRLACVMPFANDRPVGKPKAGRTAAMHARMLNRDRRRRGRLGSARLKPGRGWGRHRRPRRSGRPSMGRRWCCVRRWRRVSVRRRRLGVGIVALRIAVVRRTDRLCWPLEPVAAYKRLEQQFDIPQLLGDQPERCSLVCH